MTKRKTPTSREADINVCTCHTPGQKMHACTDWDFLVICEQCPEFECCTCYPSESLRQTTEGEVK